jgi:hypothetical protein
MPQFVNYSFSGWFFALMVWAFTGPALAQSEAGAPDTGSCPDVVMRDPAMLEFDPQGNLYIAELQGRRILKWDMGTSCLSVVVDGYQRLYGLMFNPGTTAFYFSDVGHNQIRQLDLQSGEVTIVAGNGEAGFSGDGGPARDAALDSPYDIFLDGRGALYIADTDNNRIRKVDLDTGIIETVAGTGEWGYSGNGGDPLLAKLARPHIVTGDGKGGIIIGDSFSHTIRRIAVGHNRIVTIAGTAEDISAGDGGPALEASFRYFGDLIMDGPEALIVSEYQGAKIRRIDFVNGMIERIAGTGEKGLSGDGGPALNAAMHGVTGVALDSERNIYVAEINNGRIRRIDHSTGLITTFLTGTPRD